MENNYSVPGIRSSYEDIYSEANKVESSENISEGEDRRRLEGVVWKSVAGLSGGWNNCNRGPR